jgi:hypothetical protein
MMVSVALNLLGAMGGVRLVQRFGAWTAQRRRIGPRLVRASRVLGLTWLVLSTAALVLAMTIPRGEVSTSSPDDAAALAWLRQHAQAGQRLANDGYADAGIWAPYKAGVPIVMPRSPVTDGSLPERQLVLAHVADLDATPDTRVAACALSVGYVYHGAQPPTDGWEERQFPPLEVLRSSPALQEVFRSGEAVVFQTHLRCAG